MPIYNVENYLNKCIESLIHQTYKNIEIILIDDGSTDHSYDICDSYAQKDKRITVIHKENGGVVSARKVGAEYATGYYVCSVDADDWIEKDRIFNFVEHGAVTDADMIYMDGYYKDYENRSSLIRTNVLETLYEGKQIKEVVFPMIIDTQTCFRRDVKAPQWCWGIKGFLFKKIWSEIDERISMGDDHAHLLCCLLEANSVFLMKEYGYHYVERTSSITHNLNDESLEGVKIWANNVRHHMKLHECSTILYSHMTFLEMWYIMNCHYGILLDSEHDYLYPYTDVKKGSKIAVYGAGTFGRQIVNALNHTEDYTMVLWVDKYSTHRLHKGHLVEEISQLNNTIFDYVVIAVLDAILAEEIEKNLLESGIPQKKIAKMDANVICEEYLPDGWANM